MQLSHDDFTLFGIPKQFTQDLYTLSQRWKTLQKKVHPDKFAAKDKHSKNLAMQWSIRINEAYQRLKNPISRASYLCEIHGYPKREESGNTLETEFLQQQMLWQESLETVKTEDELKNLCTEIDQNTQKTIKDLSDLLDIKKDYAQAIVAIDKLSFLKKLQEQIKIRYDTITNQ
jgi:molecular chaperone HscB